MKRTLFGVILCATAVSLAGCSSNEAPSIPTRSSTAPQTTTVVPSAVEPSVVQQPTPVPPPPPHSPPAQTPAGAPGTTVSPAGCFDPADHSGDWNMDTKVRGVGLVQGLLFDVRPGRHECWDRIVFDVDTTQEVGFRIGYVPVVTQDGSGFEVPVAGTAALQLTIDAWAPEQFVGYGFSAEWDSLREIKYAGSFEGVTTFAIGTASKVPFAVSYWLEGDTMHVIIDLYHE